jgi:hypothetical protein
MIGTYYADLTAEGLLDLDHVITIEVSGYQLQGELPAFGNQSSFLPGFTAKFRGQFLVSTDGFNSGIFAFSTPGYFRSEQHVIPTFEHCGIEVSTNQTEGFLTTYLGVPAPEYEALFLNPNNAVALGQSGAFHTLVDFNFIPSYVLDSPIGYEFVAFLNDQHQPITIGLEPPTYFLDQPLTFYLEYREIDYYLQISWQITPDEVILSGDLLWGTTVLSEMKPGVIVPSGMFLAGWENQNATATTAGTMLRYPIGTPILINGPLVLVPYFELDPNHPANQVLPIVTAVIILSVTVAIFIVLFLPEKKLPPTPVTPAQQHQAEIQKLFTEDDE